MFETKFTTEDMRAIVAASVLEISSWDAETIDDIDGMGMVLPSLVETQWNKRAWDYTWVSNVFKELFTHHTLTFWDETKTVTVTYDQEEWEVTKGSLYCWDLNEEGDRVEDSDIYCYPEEVFEQLIILADACARAYGYPEGWGL